ncbi:hypothetical protein [Paraburkholderia bryophila]|uniref:Uncharacterized protein n=1 Tax=Paraburkholderia bryophila TaxID=420952 RepID=A0A7Y9WSM0_9BURK|nr:hypothetical protein [Paraburkholderia bryophila]NYH26012.1 hypothetical protein [Paraburkholderia bryophila]
MSNLTSPNPVSAIQSYSGAIARSNPLVEAYAERPKGTRAGELLRTAGVVPTAEAYAKSPTEKLSLLHQIDSSFYSTKMEESLFGDFHDAIRTSWLHADPLSPAAAMRYAGFAKAVQSANLVAMPKAKYPGRGFLLCCASGSAGLRFVERAAEVLGPSLNYVRDIPYWPVMTVQWPSCGTVDQFYANFVATFDGNLQRASYFKTLFRPTAKKTSRPIFVMALASIVNVGILIVSGAFSRNFHPAKSETLLLFLQEFMGFTGIPVIFTCTAPVYEQVVHMGPVFGSLTSGGYEEIQWLDISSGFHGNVNLHLFNQSLTWQPANRVPDAVLDCAVMCTHGSREALNHFYRLLHVAAVRQPQATPEQLLPDVAKTMRKQTDQLQRVASYLCTTLSAKSRAEGKKQDGAAWSDFLSLDVYREMGV